MIDFATGVGVNITPEYYGQVVIDRAVPYEFLEMDPMGFDLTPDVVDTFRKLAGRYPIVLHSTTMSLCGDAPFDANDLSKVAEFAAVIGSKIYSDHLSYTWAGDVNLDLYMTPEFSDEMIDWVGVRASTIEKAVQVPFIVENVGMIVPQPHSQYSETAFLSEVISRTGTPLQLNLDSVTVSAASLKVDPNDYVASFPLDGVETIAVVPELSMNPMLRQNYGEDIDGITLEMLDYVVRNSPVDRVMVQRRAGDDGTDFDDFYSRVYEIFYRHRKAS